jgi:PAS domain S-box-containing protein
LNYANLDSDKVDILLVDDKDENLLALEAVLTAPSYNLIKRNSGAEALKYLLHNECALILLDVQMPEMDGFETAAYIKQSERSREIPIIFITAISTDERFVSAGYRSGAVDYLFKPFEPDILRSKVHVFTELYRSKREIKRQAEILRDVERKERERALAELELRSLRREQAMQTKYRELVDGISHAVLWQLNPLTQSFFFMSPSATSILGYKEAEWLAEGFLDKLLCPEDGSLLLESIAKVRDGARSLSLEHRLMRADGKELWFQSDLKLTQRGEDSPLFDIQGLSVDITARKLAEDSLHRSEERARLLGQASFLLSKSLEVDKTLEALEKLLLPRLADSFEVHVLEANGKLRCLSPSDKNDRLSLKLLDKVYRVLKTASPLVCRSVDQCGGVENAPGVILLVPMETRGRCWGVMILAYEESKRVYDAADLETARDIAHRAAIALENSRLFVEVQAAVQARDEFLSIASHELKTPLTPLKLQAQMVSKILEDLGDPSQLPREKIQRMLQSSNRQIQRLAHLVEDLLDVSRINVGKLALHREDFDFIELVTEVIEQFGSQNGERSLIVFEKPPSAALGNWDRFRLEQVIINLITNALKYGSGKPVHLTIHASSDKLTFAVQDHGIGISKTDQERIFDRFERAVSSANFGGLGLGLYIASEIVRAHGGSLGVESELGKGSRFILKLPRQQATSKVALSHAQA